MNSIKTFTAVLCLVAVFGFAVPKASGDEWNKQTKMTFTEPFEVPGMVLPAGTYTFALADSNSDRHIVQIWNADKTKIFATVLAINNYRLKATDKTVLTFEERPSNTPEAIHAWFYPGNSHGQEFVYPKERALALAAANKIPVLAIPSGVAPSLTAPVVAITPEQQEAPATEVLQTTPAQIQPATLAAAEAPTELPQTATSIPLVALVGLLCIGAGLVLRIRSKALARNRG